MNRSFRNRNWFWGAFFIVGALLLGASQLNLINYHFSFWGVIATLILAGALIQSLAMLSIGGIVFSLAFLSILYAEPLGIQALAPWTVLGIAVLLTIGLSLIFFRPRHRYWEKRLHHHGHPHGPHYHHQYNGGMVDEETVSDDKTVLNIESRMSNSIRYVRGNNLERVNVTAYMTGLKVYFDKADLVENAVIDINSRFSGVELYLPQAWQVINKTNVSLSGINENGVQQVDGKVVYLTGDVVLSGVEVYYV